jgi:hypothetical protein
MFRNPAPTLRPVEKFRPLGYLVEEAILAGGGALVCTLGDGGDDTAFPIRAAIWLSFCTFFEGWIWIAALTTSITRNRIR